MSSFISFVSNNASQIDASEAYSKLQKECPELLHTGESVILAFRDRGGKGRDDSFFTNIRVLVRDKTGLTGKKIKYLSIPYACIRAYGVTTAGSMDSDSELKVRYSEGRSLTMDFVAGSTDIFAIKRFLNDRILIDYKGATGARIPTGTFSSMTIDDQSGSGKQNFLDLLGGDSTQIDAVEIERKLKEESTCVLLTDECVELAFRCGRDSFLCTSKRLLKIDVQGISGKRVEYLSVLWKCIRAFSVETAGGFFDRDADLTLYTDISQVGRNTSGGSFPSMSRIEVDFRKGKADIYAVQRFFADKLLGVDEMDHAACSSAAVKIGRADGESGFVSDVLSWLGDDNKMIDAVEMDQQYHSYPPILQKSERVEMAFKGCRDLVLFTSKRLLIIDVQGITGKKVEYLTLPWKNVQMFGVRSAGSFMDKDSEMLIWTDFNDLWWPPKEKEDHPPPFPIPRKSFLEIDFKKNAVDLIAVHRYLSERCLRVEETGTFLTSDVPVSLDVLAAGDPDAVTKFISWLGEDAVAVDPAELDTRLHESNGMLQSNETVVLAYKSGRDLTIFTTKRVLRMDVQGFSGKKIEWHSIPYASIRAFAVESAGSWDMDSEMKLYCGTYWMNNKPGNVIKQDFRRGKADIIAIHNLLAAQIMGGVGGSSSVHYDPTGLASVKGGGGKMDTFISWASGDGVEIDAEEVNNQLRNDPPILQKDESADICFRIGRDICIFTTKRILFLDRQGITGKRVEYLSYPLRYCDAFIIESAGSIGVLREAKVSVYTSIPGASKIEQELKKKGSDIWGIHSMLVRKILGNNDGDIDIKL